jgi:hypothetical protein
MARASTRPLTAEEFFALDFPDARAELVRGEDVLPGFSCPVASLFDS